MKDSKRNRRKKSKRRNNAILYPIYKTCSWDLLSFYCIEFLFYTITKNITPSQILILTAELMIAKILFQLPSVFIADFLGKRKTIIFGNFMKLIFIILLVVSKNIIWMAIANLFLAFGSDMKTITEGNLLYDSVSTKGGDGIYTKMESKGASGYYVVDTALSLIAGYLFTINNYLPMCICLGFTVISIILSIKFKDIYEPKHDIRDFKKFVTGYSSDIKRSFKFIKQSNRIRAYLIFAAVFYSFIKVTSTYRSDLILDIGVTAWQFSLIYATLNLVAAFAVQFTKKIQNKLKNKTLTAISLTYIVLTAVAGTIAYTFTNYIAAPLIVLLYIVIRICESQWWVTEYTYLGNFTRHENRNKITFTYELITGVAASILAFLGAILLNYLDIKLAIVLFGFVFWTIIIVVLNYMETRIGLKPSEYRLEDIEFPEE